MNLLSFPGLDWILVTNVVLYSYSSVTRKKNGHLILVFWGGLFFLVFL